MKDPGHRKCPAPAEQVLALIEHLFIEDNRPNREQRLPLAVPPGQVPLAREWLNHALIDPDALLGHVEELRGRYSAALAWSRPQRHSHEGEQPVQPRPDNGFPHSQLLPADRAEAVARAGPGELSVEELAEVFLNPFALWDLADLIGVAPSEYWWRQREARGRELMSEEEAEAFLSEMKEDLRARRSPGKGRVPELALMGMVALEARGAGCWSLTFGDEEARGLARRIAEQLYGDAGRAFELLLYRFDSDEKGKVEFELEVSPAPTRNDLTFTLAFASEQERQFKLEVPPELRQDPHATPRLRVRSEPCAPLDATDGMLDERRKLEWGDEMPPRLIVRKSAGYVSGGGTLRHRRRQGEPAVGVQVHVTGGMVHDSYCPLATEHARSGHGVVARLRRCG